MSARLPDGSLQSSSTKLTPREEEIFLLSVSGKRIKEIAALLGVCVQTVKTHRACILQKAGLPPYSTFAELLLRCGRFNWDWIDRDN